MLCVAKVVEGAGRSMSGYSSRLLTPSGAPFKVAAQDSEEQDQGGIDNSVHQQEEQVDEYLAVRAP